jgi:hypothetical protein
LIIYPCYERSNQLRGRGIMEKINRRLLHFFTEHYRPGIIGVVGTKHTIGMAIREAEKKITPDGKASLWSHSFIKSTC